MKPILFTEIRTQAFIVKLTLAAILVLSVTAQVSAQNNPAAINITEFSFTPSTIDTTSSSQTVTITVRATDTERDIYQVFVSFQSPTRNTGDQYVQVALYRENLISGNARDGVYSKAIIFPQYSKAGTWKVGWVSVYDLRNFGNFNTSQLTARGFATEIQVISNNEDLISPQISEFNFTPSVIDTTKGSQNVTITFRATDATAGVKGMQVSFLRPKDLRPEDNCDGWTDEEFFCGFRLYLYASDRISGDDKDGVYRYVFTVPQNTPLGTYGVYVGAYDAVYNATNLDPENLFALGYPAQLRITSGTQFDFDGDGKADISVFRPSNSAWYLNQSTNGFTGMYFGLSTDKLTPADFDGDGKADVAVFRDGFWYLQRSLLGFTAIQFGQAGDVPVPADYDGDGKADVAVFRSGFWYILQSSNNQFRAVQFGVASDKTVPADYDGDGKADIAVVRQASGVSSWYILGTSRGFYGLQFGTDTDKLVPADYDGDGKTDQAVYRNDTWYLLRSQAGFTAFQFGLSTDIAAPADYDGDGKTDAAVFRDGNWYLLESTNGFAAQQFGLSNDKPVPTAYLP